MSFIRLQSLVFKPQILYLLRYSRNILTTNSKCFVNVLSWYFIKAPSRKTQDLQSRPLYSVEIPRESHTEWPGSSNLGGRCLLNRRGLLREASVKQMGTSFPGSLLAFVSIGVRSEEDTASQMGCELVIRKLL